MDPDYATTYADLEVTHWWFKARRRILKQLLRELALPASPAIVEIGAGSGINLYELYPADARLAGVEPDAEAAERARSKGPIPVFNAPVESLPDDIADGSLDLIAMFDVLEHTRDDRAALQAVSRKLKPGGSLVLTVPAFMLLWGRQDEVSHHFRRYTRRGLKSRLTDTGLDVLRATYFNTLLFPPIAAARTWARLRPPKHRGSGSDFDYNTGQFDGMLYGLLASEAALLRHTNLPFGVSLYAAARRPGTPTCS